MVLVYKAQRKAIYANIFEAGVMVVKKDAGLPKHADVDVPNLQVMMVMKSLRSRGYVREGYCWGWLYYYLTNEGITYLREYLGIDPSVVPNTLKRSRTAGRPERGGEDGGDGEGGRGGDGGRGNYRGDGDKKLGGGFGGDKPSFAGRGFGRGRREGGN